MISIDNFYYVLWNNLLKPYDVFEHIFYPHGTLNSVTAPYSKLTQIQQKSHQGPRLFFYDQEPLLEVQSKKFFSYIQHHEGRRDKQLIHLKQIGVDQHYDHQNKIIVANSEHSELKNSLCNEYAMEDWYYFYHGFASLYWFNDYRFLAHTDNVDFTKVFISLNRLISSNRAHRLHFVANVLEHSILDKGVVSLQLQDDLGTWEQELFRRDSLLTPDAKKTVYRNLKILSEPLTIDTGVQGDSSAKMDFELSHSALWHMVTETVYFQDKRHLTEKIFKPIISHRPFMLIGAVGNLAYLRNYGFKTFGDYVDESYDNIADNTDRINKITQELIKLCNMSETQLKEMHQDMLPILRHNFNHFYTDFKYIIVDELVDNFQSVVKNMGYSTELVDWRHSKSILLK